MQNTDFCVDQTFFVSCPIAVGLKSIYLESLEVVRQAFNNTHGLRQSLDTRLLVVNSSLLFVILDRLHLVF